MNKYLGIVVVVILVFTVAAATAASLLPLWYSGLVWRKYEADLDSLMYHTVFVRDYNPYIVGVNITDGSRLVLIDANLTIRTLASCAFPVAVVAANGSAYAICDVYLYKIDPYGYEPVKSYSVTPSFAIFNHFTNDLVVVTRHGNSSFIDVVGKNSYIIDNVHVYGAGFTSDGYYYLLYMNLTNNYWYIGKFSDDFVLVKSVMLEYTPYASESGLPDTFAVNDKAIVVVGEIASEIGGYTTTLYLHDLNLTRYNSEMFMDYVPVVTATRNYHLVLKNTTLDIDRGVIYVMNIRDVGQIGSGPADLVFEVVLGSSSKPYINRLGLIDSYMYLNDYITGLAKESNYWYLTLYGVLMASTITNTVTAAVPVYVTRSYTVTTTVTGISTGVDYFTIGLVVVTLAIFVLAIVYIFRRI